MLTPIFRAVFDVVTAGFDVNNCPDQIERCIRQISKEPRFKNLCHELEQWTLVLSAGSEFIRVRNRVNVQADDCHAQPPFRSFEMRGNPAYPPFRANLSGQPVLYCAESLDTAIAEARLKSGECITLARARLIRPVQVIDLANASLQLADGTRDPVVTLALWMSEPLTCPLPPPTEAHPHWQTQLFSCIARDQGLGGIRFGSSVHAAGINVALFDPFCVDLTCERMIT